LPTDDLAGRFEDPAFTRAEREITRARETALELLEELVQIPSVNPPGERYLEVALLLGERLRDLAFEPRLVEVPAHELKRLGLPPQRPRPSVLATLGSDAPDAPTFHFHAHYDVVPADAPRMFRMRTDGDIAWGRGTADMKGGIVYLLLALSALRPLERHLEGRIILSLVPDEETGGDAGTGYLFRSGALPPNGLGMLMPEPTSGAVWNGNRGAISQLLTLRGSMAHVALQHQGRNAFEAMLELGGMLRGLKTEVESREFGEDRLGIEGPASILLLGGTFQGGTNFNVVPETACFSIDRRFHPMEPEGDVEKELEAIYRRTRRAGWTLDVQELQRGAASLTPADTPLSRVMASVVDSVTGERPRFTLCPGILETRFFLKHGTPGLAYGPGELEISHTVDERVDIQRVLDVARVYMRMAWAILAPPPSANH